MSRYYYDAVNSHMVDLQRYANKVMDFNIWWSMASTEYVPEAERLNNRGKKQLSYNDGRTRGGKYMRKMKQEAWKKLNQ